MEVHGKTKQGAAYGYTKQLSLHPLLAVRADTGEVLHVRTRTGSANTARGVVRFVAETYGRVRRAGATGQLLWRFDSGFWNNELMMELIEGYGGQFTIGIRMQKPIAAAIGQIDDDVWVDLAAPRRDPRTITRSASASTAPYCMSSSGSRPPRVLHLGRAARPSAADLGRALPHPPSKPIGVHAGPNAPTGLTIHRDRTAA